jgi:membrane-bound serine protease (ClpP class)
MTTIVILVLVALGLFALEFFIPGGVLGAIAVLCIVIATVHSFGEFGPSVGFAVLLGGSVLCLGMIFLEMHLVAHSTLGQRLFGHKQVSTGGTGLGDTSHLIGQEGIALTRMVPGGKVKIAQSVYSAVSEDGYLEKGTPIVVKRADTFTIRVQSRS